MADSVTKTGHFVIIARVICITDGEAMTSARFFLVLAFLPVAAHAAPEGAQFSVAAASDYVWRGIAYTGRDLSYQAEAAYRAANGFYAGASGATVHDTFYPIASQAHVRGDVFGGLRVNTAIGLSWDVGVDATRFDKSRASFEEAYIGAAFGYLNAKIFYDWRHKNTYTVAGTAFDIGSGIQFDAHVGHYNGDTVPGYNDFSAGFSTHVEQWQLALMLTDTDIKPRTDRTRTHTTLSVKRSW